MSQNDDLTRSGTGCLLYSCTHMATVGVKGLTVDDTSQIRSLSNSGLQSSRCWYFATHSGDRCES